MSELTRSRAWRLLRAGLLLIALGWAALPPAHAQACYNAGNLDLAFGTVGLGGTAQATGTAPFMCQSTADATYFRVCFFLSEGPAGSNDMSGTAPRRMTNYNGGSIVYTVYSDAARTQVLGPEGGGSPAYTTGFLVPGGWSQVPLNLPVHGRVGPIAGSAPSGYYQAQFAGGVLRYAWSHSAMPADCSQGGSQTVGTFFTTHATVDNSCVVSISATDMDFGSTVPMPASSIDASSTLILNCPPNVTWQVSLSSGMHALAGQRRMAGPGGNYVPYELYQNSARTQRWGDTLGTDTYPRPSAPSQPMSLTVYGRVQAAQTDVTPGSYDDTITVTLTY